MSDPKINFRPNVDLPVTSESTPDQSTPATPASGGISDITDSLESGAGNVDSLREIYQTAKAQGKLLMSEGTLNHFLQNNMKPHQYPEAFSDLKGWVNNNFLLNEDQHQQVQALTAQDVQKVQDAGSLAAKLNIPIKLSFNDADPTNTGPKAITFREVQEPKPDPGQLSPAALLFGSDCGAGAVSDKLQQVSAELKKQAE